MYGGAHGLNQEPMDLTVTTIRKSYQQEDYRRINKAKNLIRLGDEIEILKDSA